MDKLIKCASMGNSTSRRTFYGMRFVHEDWGCEDQYNCDEIIYEYAGNQRIKDIHEKYEFELNGEKLSPTYLFIRMNNKDVSISSFDEILYSIDFKQLEYYAFAGGHNHLKVMLYEVDEKDILDVCGVEEYDDIPNKNISTKLDEYLKSDITDIEILVKGINSFYIVDEKFIDIYRDEECIEIENV